MFSFFDSTFVCPTEIIAFSDNCDKLKALNAEVIAISVDSEYSHLAWSQTKRSEGGLHPLKIPLVSDLSKSITRSFGILLNDSVALRYVLSHSQEVCSS